MIKMNLLCNYCGERWTLTVYGSVAKPKCPKCKETKNIKASKELEKGDVYGYNIKDED